MTRKQEYKCKVDDVLGRVGKAFGICAKAGVNGKCCAHGNYKCEHKEKLQNETSTTK